MRKGRALLLLVIALVDAGVIYFGVHLRSKDDNSPPPTVPVILPTSPTPTATPQEVPTHSAADVKSASGFSEPILSVLSDEIGWRTVGYCKPGVFIATKNSGASWINVPPPAAYVIYVHQIDAKRGWAIGSDVNCTRLTRYDTHDGGQHWHQRASLGKVWIPVPVGVVTPTGKVASPCGQAHATPIAFSSAGAAGTAVVICRHGVFRSADSGSSWQPVGPISSGYPAAVALTSSGSGVMLMTESRGCRKGTRVLQTSDAGASWTIGECLLVAQPPLAVGIADDGRGLLLTLSSRYRTIDFGQEWD